MHPTQEAQNCHKPTQKEFSQGEQLSPFVFRRH
jgi:hypothetical protein